MTLKNQNDKNPDRTNRIKKILKSGRKHYTKKTFIRIFAMSSIIALAVLIVTVIIQYNTFREIVGQETYKKSLDLLNQTKSIFSSIHSWVIPSFYRINSEGPVSYLMYTERPEKIPVSQGIDRMDQILASFNLFHSIYIYNYNTDEYYSTVNGYEGQECSDFNLPNILYNIDKYGVYKYIPRKMDYRIKDNIYRQDFKKLDSVNVFSVVIGNPPSPLSGNIIKGALIINISEDKIRNSLLTVNTNAGSELIIINTKGKVLSHHNKERFGEDFSSYPYIHKILIDKNEEGVFTQDIDGMRYLISFVNHPFWDWTFINLTPYETIFSSLNTFIKKITMALFLLMILVVMVAFISSMRIYSPIHQFFLYSQNLKENLKLENHEGVRKLSELQYLDRVFKIMVRKADAYENSIQKNNKIYKREAIKALLSGDMDFQELENYDKAALAEIEGGPYVLAVLQLDDFDRLSEIHTTEELAKFFHIIREMIFHYSGKENIIFIPLKNDHVCVIYNLKAEKENSPDSLQEIEKSLKRVQEAAKEKLNYTVTIGLSELFTDPYLFNEHYSLAVNATFFRFRYGNNSIIAVRDTNSNATDNYIFPEDKLKRLLNEIKLGRLPDLDKSLAEILSKINDYDYEDFTYMLHCISYNMNRTVEKLKNKLKNSYSTCKGLIQELKTIKTLDPLKHKLVEICKMIYETMQSNQTSKTAELALRIKDYINDYYADPALCTNSLSEVMGVSSYYIRFVFKNAFGVSVSEYINRIRLEYCRSQLLNTKQTVKKIYKSAGYYNYSYFFTLFKKDTGLTPNQFRIQKNT